MSTRKSNEIKTITNLEKNTKEKICKMTEDVSTMDFVLKNIKLLNRIKRCRVRLTKVPKSKFLIKKHKNFDNTKNKMKSNFKEPTKGAITKAKVNEKITDVNDSNCMESTQLDTIKSSENNKRVKRSLRNVIDLTESDSDEELRNGKTPKTPPRKNEKELKKNGTEISVDVKRTKRKLEKDGESKAAEDKAEAVESKTRTRSKNDKIISNKQEDKSGHDEKDKKETVKGNHKDEHKNKIEKETGNTKNKTKRIDKAKVNNDKRAKADNDKGAKVDNDKGGKMDDKGPKVDDVKGLRVDDDKAPKVDDDKGVKVDSDEGAKVDNEKGAKVDNEEGAKVDNEKGAKVDNEKGAKVNNDKGAKVHNDKGARKSRLEKKKKKENKNDSESSEKSINISDVNRSHDTPKQEETSKDKNIEEEKGNSTESDNTETSVVENDKSIDSHIAEKVSLSPASISIKDSNFEAQNDENKETAQNDENKEAAQNDENKEAEENKESSSKEEAVQNEENKESSSKEKAEQNDENKETEPNDENKEAEPNDENKETEQNDENEESNSKENRSPSPVASVNKNKSTENENTSQVRSSPTPPSASKKRSAQNDKNTGSNVAEKKRKEQKKKSQQIFIQLPFLESPKLKSLNRELLERETMKKSRKRFTVKKLGKTYLTAKFGARFFQCHVKIARYRDPNYPAHKKKEKNNRKSVSFVETVEIFGEDDDNISITEARSTSTPTVNKDDTKLSESNSETSIFETPTKKRKLNSLKSSDILINEHIQQSDEKIPRLSFDKDEKDEVMENVETLEENDNNIQSTENEVNIDDSDIVSKEDETNNLEKLEVDEDKMEALPSNEDDEMQDIAVDNKEYEENTGSEEQEQIMETEILNESTDSSPARSPIIEDRNLSDLFDDLRKTDKENTLKLHKENEEPISVSGIDEDVEMLGLDTENTEEVDDCDIENTKDFEETDNVDQYITKGNDLDLINDVNKVSKIVDDNIVKVNVNTALEEEHDSSSNHSLSLNFQKETKNLEDFTDDSRRPLIQNSKNRMFSLEEDDDDIFVDTDIITTETISSLHFSNNAEIISDDDEPFKDIIESTKQDSTLSNSQSEVIREDVLETKGTKFSLNTFFQTLKTKIMPDSDEKTPSKDTDHDEDNLL